MKYDVADISPDTDLREDLPRLLILPSFNSFYQNRNFSRQEKNNIIRYISFMYDDKSEYIGEYRVLTKRKDACALAADFKKKGDVFIEPYRQFMKLSTDTARRLILSFLIDQHNYIWTEICTTENELEELTELRMEPIRKVVTKLGKGKKKEEVEELGDKEILEAATKKEKLLDACSKRIKYLDELYKKFYNDNIDVEAATKDYPITPENSLELVPTY